MQTLAQRLEPGILSFALRRNGAASHKKTDIDERHWQVCNAAERVYVEQPVADKFVSALADSMKATRCGDRLGDKEIGMRQARAATT
jgi:acyl-CoA reductase-like NAD-dependent aldehyde dehydrogenase